MAWLISVLHPGLNVRSCNTPPPNRADFPWGGEVDVLGLLALQQSEVDRVRGLRASDILVPFQAEQKQRSGAGRWQWWELSLAAFRVVGCFFTSRSWLGISHVNKTMKKTPSRGK